MAEHIVSNLNLYSVTKQHGIWNRGLFSTAEAKVPVSICWHIIQCYFAAVHLNAVFCIWGGSSSCMEGWQEREPITAESRNSDTSHLAEGLFPSHEQLTSKGYCSLTVLGQHRTVAVFINRQQHFYRGQHLHQSLPLPQGSGKWGEGETVW